MAQRKKKSLSTSRALVPTGGSNALAEFASNFDPSLTAGAKSKTSGLAPFLSTEGGQLRFGDTRFEEDAVEAVVLGVAVENTLYPGAYVKGKPASPICFYIGNDEDAAAPDPKSPQAQAKSCDICPKNAWGSKGGGSNAKACRQSRRLLLLLLGEGEDPTKATLCRLRVPPTSIRYVKEYVTKIESVRPVQTVVTRIGLEPHEKNRFEVSLSLVRQIDDRDTLAAISDKLSYGKDSLFAIPMVSAEAEPAKQVAGGRRIVKR